MLGVVFVQARAGVVLDRSGDRRRRTRTAGLSRSAYRGVSARAANVVVAAERRERHARGERLPATIARAAGQYDRLGTAVLGRLASVATAAPCGGRAQSALRTVPCLRSARRRELRASHAPLSCSARTARAERRRAAPGRLVRSSKPAASYSPRPLRAKYHRR